MTAFLGMRARLLWWVLNHVPPARKALAAGRGVWHSVCDRLAEWLLTLWLLNWGLTLAQGKTFEGPAYATLGDWAEIEIWALFCVLGGGGRLALLVVNGAWRKSPHLRVFAALGTIPFWMAIASGFALSHTSTTGTGAYAVCILAELVSMYRATREAGWNDGRAAHQRNRG